jgi:hypothetical protein
MVEQLIVITGAGASKDATHSRPLNNDYRPGLDGAAVYCEDCARREFAPDAQPSWRWPRVRRRHASKSGFLILTQPRSPGR